MPFIPHTPEEQQEMLSAIGVDSIEALFGDIPTKFRAGQLNLPQGLSEMEVRQKLEKTASRNHTDLTSFLGAGFYDHYIPSAVDALCSRGEFYTAYTPYQAEASQGMLQAIFEYQTAVARLLDLQYANASLSSRTRTSSEPSRISRPSSPRPGNTRSCRSSPPTRSCSPS
jgi:glycine dehydrogenase subunit 1